MHKSDTVITVSGSIQLAVGDAIEVYSDAWRPRGLYRVYTVHSLTSVTLKASLSIWERIWFYIRHPKWWAFALDIPFTPPDILVGH